MAEQLTLRIITPERTVVDTPASSVRMPATDGSMGVFPRHAAMVAALDAGELLYKQDGQEHVLFVAGGFAEVRDNTLRILTPAGEMPEEIDVERAKEAEASWFTARAAGGGTRRSRAPPRRRSPVIGGRAPRATSTGPAPPPAARARS